jgi:hypothetical protein
VSDDLVISGGGSTEVATAELLSQKQHLRTLAAELDACLGRLHTIDNRITTARLRTVDAPLSSMRAEHAIVEARASARSARERAEFLSSSLALAATAYGDAEALAGRIAQEMGSTLAYQLGLWLPVIATLVLPSLLAGGLALGGGAALGYVLTPEAERKKVIGRWMRDNKRVLRDPRFVGFVRLAVSSADDFAEGVIRLPEPIGQLLGDEGLGILGVGSSAAVVVGLAGPAGALRETPVKVAAASVKDGPPPPQSFEERAKRIPTGENQIRIDRYSEVGKPDRFEVYLGGTIDGSVVAGREPWDMTSNLTAVAGGTAGSLAATKQAMALAGIDSSTPVTFSGYSQGGLLSAMLASSGDYDTKGLFTLGGPAGQVAVPHDIPYVALEHADDLVPATGGIWKSSDPLLVTRTVYAGQADAGDAFFPAHELSNYRETARLADASDEQRLVAARDTLHQFSDGTTGVQSSYFHAIRTRQ